MYNLASWCELLTQDYQCDSGSAMSHVIAQLTRVLSSICLQD